LFTVEKQQNSLLSGAREVIGQGTFRVDFDLVVTKNFFMLKIKTVVSLIGLLAVLSFAPTNEKNGVDKGDKLISSNSLSLQQALQKYDESLVLINFWAAYDADSHMENIKMARVNEKYKGKQFENAKGLAMVSLSLDAFQSVFTETLKRDQTQADENIFVEKGFESDVAKTYLSKGNFGNVLIDAQGVVIAKNISASQLEALLLQQ
jgi:thiol-disulfide isomerase/thioredoxin